MADRTPREQESRDKVTRKRPWETTSLLPDPAPEEGWRFRWVRASIFAEPDNSNVNVRFREGWVPVKAEAYPDIAAMKDVRSQFTDAIEIGGLVLCKMPEEDAQARNQYFSDKAKSQMRSVNSALESQRHPAMPMTNESVTRER
jgi:hypothetical protein